MTREEASNILDDYDVNFEVHTAEEIAKAFDVAFKALEQEPKTGHWINIGLEGEIDEQIVSAFSCSECGAISIFRIGYKKLINSDLCPNCGAKMVEPESEAQE